MQSLIWVYAVISGGNRRIQEGGAQPGNIGWADPGEGVGRIEAGGPNRARDSGAARAVTAITSAPQSPNPTPQFLTSAPLCGARHPVAKGRALRDETWFILDFSFCTHLLKLGNDERLDSGPLISRPASWRAYECSHQL